MNINDIQEESPIFAELVRPQVEDEIEEDDLTNFIALSSIFFLLFIPVVEYFSTKGQI